MGCDSVLNWVSEVTRLEPESPQKLSENFDEDITEDEDNNDELVNAEAPMLGSTKKGSLDMRPTLFSESSLAPVIFSPFLGVAKKSFLSTNGLDVPVPRGSRSVNREAKS